MNIGVEAKEEKGEECRLAPICRDDYLQHHVRTKACEALAQLPFALSLYSGSLSLSLILTVITCDHLSVFVCLF